jgi:hypothetical protein
MHRVIENTYGLPLGAPQVETTLSVPNDMGMVTHQLWYNGCLVKETEFEACARAAAPVAATPGTGAVPVAAPVSSDASALGYAALSMVGLALF